MTTPRMTTVLVAVTPHSEMGPHAYSVRSVPDGEVAPAYWSEETMPDMPGRVGGLTEERRLAVLLHLARTYQDRRAVKIRRATADEEQLQVESDDFDLRAFRVELRLVSKGRSE